MTFDPKEARALVERLLWLEAQYRDAGRIIAEDFKEAAASLTAALDEIERLREALEYIAEAAEQPTYNCLEVGFRHTPLKPSEIAERTAETCRFIAQDARAALKGDDQ